MFTLHGDFVAIWELGSLLWVMKAECHQDLARLAFGEALAGYSFFSRIYQVRRKLYTEAHVVSLLKKLG